MILLESTIIGDLLSIDKDRKAYGQAQLEGRLRSALASLGNGETEAAIDEYYTVIAELETVGADVPLILHDLEGEYLNFEDEVGFLVEI